jgi:phage terminase large subunit-like protein
MHLAPGFVAAVTAKYKGSRLGRQELDGEFVLDVEGALWTWEMIEATRRPRLDRVDRVVVAVDPPVSSGKAADECGIVVAGMNAGDWMAEVIADGSAQGLSPLGWAERAVALYHAYGADRLIAEGNQGGNLVAELIQRVDRTVPVRMVRARHGKSVRAEPVAVLYEQGRVRHRGVFEALEAQMLQMTAGGYLGRGSPDRVDALVWAITDLMLSSPDSPRIRPL